MRTRPRLTRPCTMLLAALPVMAAALLPAAAQSPPQGPNDTGVVADDDLSIVIATRFVKAQAGEASPKAQFTGARIPLSAFNSTDHCIDQGALEVAQEYFNTLGRALAKAAFFYTVPDEEAKRLASVCQQTHGPAQAWVDGTIKIIAFGQAVPSAQAPQLEEAMR